MDVTKIGKYDIVRELGRGAMGIVYEGVDPVIGRKVAIKTIRFDTLTDDREYAEMYQRFLREARAAGNLSHPSIVTIYEVGESDGLTYIAMEFIQGESLEARIAAGHKLAIDSVIALIAQLGDALDYAHRHGIVHRDIKPANILIDRDERPRLVDFGIARVASSSLTQTNAVLGTPYYMAPEQIAGLTVDNRTDLFALGTVLYEMLTLTKPFAGANVTTVIYKIMHVDPQPPREIDSTLPPGLDAIIRTALAKDPDQRFQSARELTLALRSHRQAIGREDTVGPGVPAMSPSSTVRIAAGGTVMTPAHNEVAAGSIAAGPMADDDDNTTIGDVPVLAAAPAPAATPVPAAAPAPAAADTPVPAAAPAISAQPSAAPVARAVPIQAAAPVVPPARAPVAAAADDVRRKRLLAVVGAMLTVVAVVIVVLLVASGKGQPPQSKPAEGGGPAPAAETPVEAPPPLVPVAAPPAPAPPVAAGATVPPADPARTTRPAAPAAAGAAASPSAGGRASKPPSAAGGSAAPRAPVKPGTLPEPPPLPGAPSEAPVVPQATSGRVYQVTEVDVKPTIARTAAPVYPPDAARRRIEDVVVVKALVAEDGRVADVQILRASTKDPAFNAAAIAAVHAYRFTPAQKKGKAVPCWFNLGVPFQLK